MLELVVVLVLAEVFLKRKAGEKSAIPEEEPRCEEDKLEEPDEHEHGGDETLRRNVRERNREAEAADVDVGEEFLLRVEIDDGVLVVGLLEFDSKIVVELVEVSVVVWRDSAEWHVEASHCAGQVGDAVRVEAWDRVDFEAGDVVLLGKEMSGDATRHAKANDGDRERLRSLLWWCCCSCGIRTVFSEICWRWRRFTTGIDCSDHFLCVGIFVEI